MPKIAQAALIRTVSRLAGFSSAYVRPKLNQDPLGQAFFRETELVNIVKLCLYLHEEVVLLLPLPESFLLPLHPIHHHLLLLASPSMLHLHHLAHLLHTSSIRLRLPFNDDEYKFYAHDLMGRIYT